MLKNLLFGQYVYKKSIIHNLDTRLKLLYVIILSISVFLIEDFSKILVFSFIILLVVLLSKLKPMDVIKGLKPFYYIFVFIFVMYIIFSKNKLEQGIITIWRFLMLISISLILTFTTTVSSLITAIEKMIKPLKFLNAKPRNVATMISIAIRFVPVMFLNMEKLKMAMLARLANFKRLKHIKLLIIALLERMLKSASTLSDAMQSRLYNENIESRKKLRFGNLDYLSIVFISIVIFVFIIY